MSSSSSSTNISPLTGVIQESDVIVDFGQFEGQTVESIREQDPDFYQQLLDAKESDSIAIRRNRDKTFRLYLNPLSQISN